MNSSLSYVRSNIRKFKHNLSHTTRHSVSQIARKTVSGSKGIQQEALIITTESPFYDFLCTTQFFFSTTNFQDPLLKG